MVFERLRRALAPKEPKEVHETFAETQGDTELPSAELTKEVVEREDFNTLDRIYMKDPAVFNGVNMLAREVVAPGYILEGGSQEVRLELRQWLTSTYFIPKTVAVTRDILKFGNGYWELRPSKKNKHIVDYDVIDAKSMDYIRDPNTKIAKLDKKGNILGWIQELQGGTIKHEFTKREHPNTHPRILHFTINQSGVGKLGVGLIEPLVKAEKIKLNLEEASGKVGYRLGLPILHAKIGDEVHYPTDDDLSKAKTDLKDFHTDNLLVTRYNTDVDLLQPENIGSLESVLQYFKMQISASLGVPAIILYGLGEGVNKATSRVLIEQFYRNVTAYQEVIGQKIQELITRYCTDRDYDKEDIPRFRFKDPRVESLDTFSDRLKDYITSGAIVPDKELERYIRERELLPEKEEVEEESVEVEEETSEDLQEEGEWFPTGDQYVDPEELARIADGLTDDMTGSYKEFLQAAKDALEEYGE